jgi:hypothetical protein
LTHGRFSQQHIQQFLAERLPPQIRNLMDGRNRLEIWRANTTESKSVSVGSKPAEWHFCYLNAVLHRLMGVFLSSSYNCSWPSGHHIRVEIWWISPTDLKSDRLLQQSWNLLVWVQNLLNDIFCVVKV